MKHFKLKNPFRLLTKFELSLWSVSLIGVLLSFFLSPDRDYLTLASSLVGVTALIFIAHGLVAGQILCIIFAVLYGTVSIIFGYWGEALTYIGMSLPAAVAATISWIKNPYADTDVVRVSKMTKKSTVLMFILAVPVTLLFYFLLALLKTPNLFFSALSVTTSFVAAFLSFMRSPFFALAYVSNDIVLIVLWVLAAIEDISYLPMVLCFVMFLFNDTYSFINWQRMDKAQAAQ